LALRTAPITLISSLGVTPDLPHALTGPRRVRGCGRSEAGLPVHDQEQDARDEAAPGGRLVSARKVIRHQIPSRRLPLKPGNQLACQFEIRHRTKSRLFKAMPRDGLKPGGACDGTEALVQDGSNVIFDARGGSAPRLATQGP
jgi:hypothetical protein